MLPLVKRAAPVISHGGYAMSGAIGSAGSTATGDDNGEQLNSAVCARCRRVLPAAGGYRLPNGERRCGRCVWRHRAIVRRALITALIVGTILTLVNQGDRLLAGDLSGPMLLKMGLTYCVPYCVSTSGAVGMSRVR